MTAKKKSTDPDSLADEWATIGISKVREMLGYKSDNAVRALINRGDLPAYRISNRPGSTIRVRVSDVIALLQPVIPSRVLDAARFRQPGPLHPPMPS